MNIRHCTTLEELKKELDEMETIQASQAIRAKCYECSAFQMTEVNACQIKDYPLWIYRDKRRKKNQEKTQTK